MAGLFIRAITGWARILALLVQVRQPVRRQVLAHRRLVRALRRAQRLQRQRQQQQRYNEPRKHRNTF
jgi:hypothetical protein